MIWLTAWFELNARLFAEIYYGTPRRPEHTATVIDLSEQRRLRQGRRA